MQKEYFPRALCIRHATAGSTWHRPEKQDRPVGSSSYGRTATDRHESAICYGCHDSSSCSVRPLRPDRVHAKAIPPQSLYLLPDRLSPPHPVAPRNGSEAIRPTDGKPVSSTNSFLFSIRLELQLPPRPKNRANGSNPKPDRPSCERCQPILRLFRGSRWAAKQRNSAQQSIPQVLLQPSVMQTFRKCIGATPRHRF